MSVLLLILGLIMFIGLVVVHEYGHFIAARRNGVGVEEFGIGFPPTAWSRKLKSGLLFSLNWLPLGGFVRLKGEHDSATAKGSFGAASLSTKVKIMTAGVGMNLLTAFIMLTFLALIGMPKLLDNQFTITGDTKVVKNQVLVGYVEPNSPAAKTGLTVRDRLLSIQGASKGYAITSAEELPKVTQQMAGQQVKLVVEREGREQTLTTTLRSHQEVEASKTTSEPKGYLGVSPTEFTLRRSTWSAPVVALGFIKQLTVETFRGLGGALWNAVRGHGKEASSQVSGPVGIFVILKDGSLLGFQFVLMIIAIISLTLAIMNVLPIPALDGGRLFVTLLYRKVLRRPLSQSLEERIHGTGFAALMLLFILITVVDVRRFF
jgi:regulator of sigma E protease